MRKTFLDRLIEWIISRHEALQYPFEMRELITVATIRDQVMRVDVTWFLTANELGNTNYAWHSPITVLTETLHQSDVYREVIQPWVHGMMGSIDLNKLFEKYPERVTLPGKEITLTPIPIPVSGPLERKISTAQFMSIHQLELHGAGNTHSNPSLFARSAVLKCGDTIDFHGSDRLQYSCYNTGKRWLRVWLSKTNQLEKVEFVTGGGEPWNGRDYSTSKIWRRLAA